MNTLAKTLFLLVALSTLGAAFSAQFSTVKSHAGHVNASSIVIAQATENILYFMAFQPVSRLRLEVFDQNGNSLFNSEYRLGNLNGWPLKNQHGATMLDGLYSCRVTLEGQSDGLSQHQTFFALRAGRIYFVTQPEKTNASSEDAGQFWVGVAESGTALDVAGSIHTSREILLPDGSVQRTAATAGGVVGVVERTNIDSKRAEGNNSVMSSRVPNASAAPVPRGFFWTADGERRTTAGSNRIGPVAATEIGPTGTFRIYLPLIVR